jgi:fermentation-respiration switch protein FrsA (DUF1100 family)
MRLTRASGKRRTLFWAAAPAALIFCATPLAIWEAGGFLSKPVNHAIGAPPDDLRAQNVQFESASGSTLHGWLIPGGPGGRAVVLMHGYRGDRRQMLGRARFLNRAGYNVLLFDFQAHGESPGKHITIGYLESRDAQAALAFMKRNYPAEKLGVVGVSMGGAAAVLASPTLPELGAGALVLEMVYADVDRATANRLEIYLGPLGRRLAPLLTMQLPLREEVDATALRPIDRVAAIKAPVLFIAGAKDRHTKLEESRELFAAAREPKELWVVEEAAHVDVHQLAPKEYERRVLEFFEKRLR